VLSRIRRLPSPALVISVIALIVAVGGGSVAIALTDNQKDKKIANAQITKRAPGLSVKHANSAKSLDQLKFVRTNPAVTVNAGDDGSAIANCPSGFKATGGGGTYPVENGVQVIDSVPINGTAGQAGFTGWEFSIRNLGSFARNLRAYVICAKAGSASGNYSPGSSVN